MLKKNLRTPKIINQYPYLYFLPKIKKKNRLLLKSYNVCLCKAVVRLCFYKRQTQLLKKKSTSCFGNETKLLDKFKNFKFCRRQLPPFASDWPRACFDVTIIN